MRNIYSGYLLDFPPLDTFIWDHQGINNPLGYHYIKEKTLYSLSMGIYSIRNNYLRSTCDPNYRHGVPNGLSINTVQHLKKNILAKHGYFLNQK